MSTVAPREYRQVLTTFQFNEKVMRYLQQQIESYIEEHSEIDRLQMEECNPDVLEHHPIVTTKLDRLKEYLYTNRAALVVWFQDLARSLQQSQDTTLTVKLELNRTGQTVNWKECRFGFVVKECVTGIFQKAKRRVMRLPRLEPEEGYRTGFVLSVHFQEKLQEDLSYYKFYVASQLRVKHSEIATRRQDYYQRQRIERLSSSPFQNIHPLLVGPYFNQLEANYGGGGGGAVAGASGGVVAGGGGSRGGLPRQSELARRVLCSEFSEGSLRCPICLEEEELSVESCIMFNCSHYVCERCYPSLEGRLCPICRKQIKVSCD